MSETFEKVLVKDDRLGCITSKVKYQVFKGGQNITCTPFMAQSQSASTHVYNIPVPSLETIISREVLWKSTVAFKISTQNKLAYEYAVNYGVTDALAPFPLHSLVNTMQVIINNNTVAHNFQETLPILLRMVDPEEFAKYDSMTPTALDCLADYKDGVQPLDFTLGRNNLNNPTVLQPVDCQQAYLSFPNNSLAHDQNRPAGTAYYHKPRGSWKLRKLYALTGNARRTPTRDDAEVYAEFDVCEPLLMSPFIFGSGQGKQGFYGIQMMSIQMNLTGNANRAWRSAVFNGTKNVTVADFKDSQLLFQFLTPHASDMLDPRNVVPFYEMKHYPTSNFPPLPARAPHHDTLGNFNEPQTVTLNSTSLQLNGIPDKLIVFVRKRISSLSCSETDSYATRKGISINFNNLAGLLSSMTPEQLYINSVHSGLANMSWDEFSGGMMSVCGTSPTPPVNPNVYPSSRQRTAYSGVGAFAIGDRQNLGVQYVPTTGTILVLNFAEVIQLTEEYYAPGSLGNFNLQLSVQAVNNQGTAMAR